MFRTAFSIFSVVLLLGVASDTGSAQPRGELDKQRLAQRQKRLDAFQAVCLDWHRKSIGLSDKTTDELKDAMNSLIEADQKVWNRQEDFQRFYFAGWASGAAYGLLNDKVKGASESKWVLIRDAILDESKKKSWLRNSLPEMNGSAISRLTG